MTKMDRIPEDLKVYAVTESGKIYWSKRNTRGQFVNAYGRNRQDGLRDEYAAYVEARISQAERAVRGYMLSRRGMSRWVSVADIMAGRRSALNASPELRDWLEVYGRTLGFREFCAQAREAEAA